MSTPCAAAQAASCPTVSLERSRRTQREPSGSRSPTSITPSSPASGSGPVEGVWNRGAGS